MSSPRTSLAKLHQVAPEGLVVTRKHLLGTGLSSAALDRYVKSGWLHLVGRGAYLRGPEQALARPLRWQQLAISLQRAGLPVHVGGGSALAMHGLHHPDPEKPMLDLFGKARLPAWSAQVRVREQLRLQRFLLMPPKVKAGLVPVQWGPWDWVMWISTPERALLEALALVPDIHGFEEMDRVFAKSSGLDISQLNALLGWSKHVQVNRLCLWFADRHAHAWNEALQRDRIFKGSGKRQVVAGGKLDRAYQITVPAEFA